MAATFSNPRLAAEPCELMRGCSFADNLVNLTTIAANTGTVTGSGVTADHGITGTGIGGYDYDEVLQKSDFSVTLQFNTTTTASGDAAIFGNAITSASADDGFTVWVDADGVKANHSNGSLWPTECAVDLDYADGVTHTVTYIVDMTGGQHHLYVDALAVDTQTTTVNVMIGGTLDLSILGKAGYYFTGTVYKPRIFNAILTEAEHDLYHAGTVTSWWDSPTAKFKCDAFGDDDAGGFIWDATLNLNDLNKGDNTNYFPTFVVDKYSFDLVDDYIDGWPTWPAAFTVNAAVSTPYEPFPSVTQQNDNTLTDELDTSGTYFGYLHNLTIFASALTQLQLYHAEYKHLYWLERGRAVGAYHRLITEGTCKLALFMDGDRGIYTNLAPLNDAGLATLVTRGSPAANGCTFASATSNVEFTHNAAYNSDELTLAVYGDFTEKQALNVLTDGDMEASGTSAYVANNGAVLSKVTTNPYEGTQLLRVAYGGSANPNARQVCMTIGVDYVITGRARSDGTAVPRIYDSGTLIWTGTNSTDWQEINVARTAASTQIRIYNFSSAGYTEFDDLAISDSEYPGVIIDKGTDYKLLTEGDSIDFNGSTIAHTFDDNEQIAVTVKPGFKPRFYVDGEYIGEGSASVDLDDSAIADGDMEAAGVASWPVVVAGTITKDVTDPHSGTQCLRVAHSGTSNPRVGQATQTIGKEYLLTAWARGDGSHTFQFKDGSQNLGSGSVSTSWQEVTKTFTATTTTVTLIALTTGAGYAEFDDVSIVEVSNLTTGNTNEYDSATSYAIKQIYEGDKALSDREIKALYEEAQSIGATIMETGQRVAVAAETFTAAAVDYDTDPGDNFQLIDIAMTWNTAPTTSENITIFSIRESVKVTEYSFDPSTSTNTQHMFRFDKRFEDGVTYGIDYTNTDGRTIVVYSTYQLDPSIT